MSDAPRRFFGMVVHLVPAGTVVDSYGPHASVRRVTARSGVLGVGECWMTPAMYAEISRAYDDNSNVGGCHGCL